MVFASFVSTKIFMSLVCNESAPKGYHISEKKAYPD